MAVYKSASAKRDLVEDYVYLAEHAGIETDERFLSFADDSFNDLSRHPEMGVAVSLRDPRLAGLRRWRINGFETFLIFYVPREDGVLIVRVLHAAQDWWSLLGIV